MEEMKTISVAEFIEKYDAAETTEEKRKVIESVISTKYVGFKTKLDVSKSIIKQFNLQNGDVHSQTAMMYLAFTASALRLYTCLDISETETNKDYDMLQEKGLIDAIYSMITKDLKEYKKIFDMCAQDFTTNFLSTPAFVQKQVNKINNGFNNFADKVVAWIDGLDEDTIVEKVIKILNKTK